MTEEATVAADDAAEWAYLYAQEKAKNEQMKVRILGSWAMISTVSTIIDRMEDIAFMQDGKEKSEKMAHNQMDFFKANPILEMLIMLEQALPLAFQMSDAERDHLVDKKFSFADIQPELSKRLKAQVDFSIDACKQEWNTWAEANGWSSFEEAENNHRARLMERMIKAMKKKGEKDAKSTE